MTMYVKQQILTYRYFW